MAKNDTLMDLIREAQPTLSDDGTITSKELADLIGCNRDKARQMLGDLIEAGKMRPVRSPRKQITGIICTAWAYEMVDDD